MLDANGADVQDEAMQINSLSEQLFFCTVHISASSAEGDWTGTGFLVQVPVKGHNLESEGVLMLITNKHVFEGAESVTFQMVRADANGLPTAAATDLQVTKFTDQAWTGHPNPAVDVAVIPFGVVQVGMSMHLGAPVSRAFAIDDFLTQEQADALDAIEPVTFIGYPNGIFDSKNFLPVARRGHTATPVSVDYEGEPAVLIDASVFPGSSGSPVVIARDGLSPDKSGTMVLGSPKLTLIGIVAAVHVRQVDGPVTILPSSYIATVEDAIDLGIVYKASAILECIDAHLEKEGFERV